ncbi:MAG: hypothetical protein A2751_04195 [Candidatus Doudnabacteria bacterium RIFCSPHIGHO2_01_FULL_46_14]|uniref:Photosynthesis system II assembly factor Ycf48/Hcf136-like domain-containing protein n=1 Tax=Candidatus Doudnabacteria bacterium RIFCSPHIGHO2_01_FULL_46_14 TaxID=1817824 RepID=A0A1F5NL95_9BACT|nr:MAG: hypothetical protein A2751_04195 [Candidatus Doudnabacteria bacterium RIFCSPHIGHO2_01_FULL_46_14]
MSTNIRIKTAVLILPVIFTAQACDLLGSGSSGSGSQGVFYSVDGADSWQIGLSKEENLDMNRLMISRLFIEGSKPQNIVAASSNTGLAVSDSHGEKWQLLLPGFLAHDAFINPFNDQEIFVAGARDRLAVIYKSADRGASWLQVYNEPLGKAVVTTLAFDRSSPKTMFAGLSSGTVLKSSDSGDTWNSLADFDDRIVDMVVAQSLIYALGQQSGLQRSTDGGMSWTKVAFSESVTAFNDLYMDPSVLGTLYVATSLGLYRTEDMGVTWNKLPIPATPEVRDVTSVAVNPGKKNQIFAAIRSTIYRSDDNGANWRTIQLPSNRTIASIVIDPFEPNRIYAGLK